MEVQVLIGEVARRHGILLGSNDPAFALLTVNELVLREYVERCRAAIEHAQDELSASAAEQVEATKDIATRLVQGASRHVSEQLRKASKGIQLELTQAVHQELAEARQAAAWARSAARSVWWAVCSAAVAILVAVSWLVLVVLKT